MMFNRYIPGGFDLPPPEARETGPPAQEDGAAVFTDVRADEPPAPEVPAEPEKKGLISNLKGLFGGNVKLPDMNADTLLLLVLVYFLVADDKENISDTLLIVGVLLLLGF